MAKDGLETVKTLAQMHRDLSISTLHELRNGGSPDPRSRIEKIRTANPKDYEHGVYTNGGNSSLYVFDRNGRRVQRFESGVTINYLGRRTDNIEIAIYPFGVAGVTEAGQPIFEDPGTSERVSLAVEVGKHDYKTPFLQRSMEPLFNIDQDGNVFARISDQPTPVELQLLYDILDQFEAVALKD